MRRFQKLRGTVHWSRDAYDRGARCQLSSATSVELTYSTAMRTASTQPPEGSRASWHLSSPDTPRGRESRDATDQSPTVSLSEHWIKDAGTAQRAAHSTASSILGRSLGES
ncbi:hypothetical protein GGG16DRAFT_128455 [Schizophyllum commune]